MKNNDLVDDKFASLNMKWTMKRKLPPVYESALLASIAFPPQQLFPFHIKYR